MRHCVVMRYLFRCSHRKIVYGQWQDEPAISAGQYLCFLTFSMQHKTNSGIIRQCTVFCAVRGQYNSHTIIVEKTNLVIFVYLSLLPVAHHSDAPRRRLVATGDSARIQDETTESFARHIASSPRINVSLLVIF